MASAAARRTPRRNYAGGALANGDRIPNRSAFASPRQASNAPTDALVQQATTAWAATLAGLCSRSRPPLLADLPGILGSPKHGLVYGVAAPIASAAQAPNKVQASMARALSGLRQRCRENNDAGLRQASMARLQSGKTRWRRPRNLAVRRLSQRDGNRTTAHWTMRRAFVYE